jgi:hypothetical protein
MVKEKMWMFMVMFHVDAMIPKRFDMDLGVHADLMGDLLDFNGDVPSGKRLHNCGKSPCSMGKSTINGHFQ